MSHVTTIATEIRDLQALRDACKALGVEWREGQREYAWYGKHAGDYPIPDGMTKEQLGHCDHAIRVPGVRYEIGVVKTATGYTLAYDFYGNLHCDFYRRDNGENINRHDGGLLRQRFGDGLGKLVQAYGVQKTIREALRAGMHARQQVQADGSIRVVLTQR